MRAKQKFITRSELAARWGKCSRTVRRMELAPPPGFPVSIEIGGRYHFDIDAIEAFERALVNRGARQMEAA